MPRNPSGVYSIPPGTNGIPDTVIESAKYNAYVADVEQDLNYPRPIVAGGTGASSADAALVALSGEKAKQVVTNFDAAVFVPGSFYAATTATASPVAGHAFGGIAYAADATNMVVEARDLTDTAHPRYVRVMSGGVWGAWVQSGYDAAAADARFVNVAGDTMTGALGLVAPPVNPTDAAAKSYVDGLDAAQKTYIDAGDATTQSNAQTYTDAQIAAKAVRYDAAQALTSPQQAQAQANIGLSPSGKNYILNSAMMVSQENGVNPGTTSGYAAADQWANGFSNAGTCSFAQVASFTPSGAIYRLRYTVTAADAAVAAGDYAYIATKLEGFRVADLRYGSAQAKTVTLRFGVKAPAGTYCINIANNDFTMSQVFEYTISAGEANTDVVKTLTFAGPSGGAWQITSNIGMTIFWTLMCGTTYQKPAGAWSVDSPAGTKLGSANQFNFMGTNGNVFELFDVSLTVGATAPPYQVPNYPDELLACQRYLSYPEAGAQIGSGTIGGSYYGDVQPFPVQMRTQPTVTVLANVNAPANVTSIAIGGSTPTAFMHYGLATASSTSFQYWAKFKANARL